MWAEIGFVQQYEKRWMFVNKHFLYLDDRPIVNAILNISIDNLQLI